MILVGKKIRKINLGEHQTKIVIVLSAEPTPETGNIGEDAKKSLLETIINTPALGFYDAKPYERLKMFHDGERWIAEMEMVITNERKLGQ